MLTLATVTAARERIADRVHVTPVMSVNRLGARVGARLVLKCENFQKTGSFKSRGALSKLSQLDRAAGEKGVITFSAGNHAQALAWAGRATGVSATVVMPTWASRAKVEASREYGAKVVLHGSNAVETLSRARELEKEHGLTFIHPFDDELVAAGQGTTGLELMDQVRDIDVVVVPIGGGGLIAGVLVAIKESNPKIRVYGVEPIGAPGMRRSLDEGHPVSLDKVSTIADGLAAPMAGTLNFEIVRKYVDDVVLIDDSLIRDALGDLLFSAKILAETAGAAATAAVLGRAIPFRQGECVAAIVSGGNIDAEKLTGLLR